MPRFIIKLFLNSGYRRSTLVLVSIFMAIFTIAIVTTFYIQDLRHKDLDDQRTVTMISQMLSQSMLLPLYSGQEGEVKNLALQAIKKFNISRVQVMRPDGSTYLDISQAANTQKLTSSKAPITVTQTLDPIASISGEVRPEEQLGYVIASTAGSDRQEELRNSLIKLSVNGLLLWIVTSYLGYLIMRQLTKSYDKLVDAIGLIEQGKTEKIEVDLQDEAKYIASSINRLSLTLHERERQNISLEQKLSQQMEERAKNAEEVLRVKLMHVDKLAMLGTLVSCMGHEINNPNAVIRLQNEVIKKIACDIRPILDDASKEEGNYYIGGMPYKEATEVLFDNIEGIHQQTNNIERVVSELRNFITADSKEKTSIGIDRVILGTLVLINPELKRYSGKIVSKMRDGNKRAEKIQKTYVGVERRSKIHANQYSLQQVLLNLLHNSIRATKNKGPDGQVEIDILSHSDKLEVIVSDNGEGIHPEDLPKVCDPYYSRNLGNGGTGLGLYIAKQIMNDHNATMKFVSQLGVGTSVHLLFNKAGSAA